MVLDIEINKNQNVIIDLFEKNIDNINILGNRLILVHKKIYYCIYTIDNSNIFFKIKRKKMIIKINDSVNYDSSVDFENQPDEIKSEIMKIHESRKEIIEFDEESRPKIEFSNNETFFVRVEYLYYSDGWLTRELQPQKLIKVEEIL